MANALNYTNPATGATAPTAVQARTHQTMKATVTGDGATLTMTFTHNWGISAAQLALGFPNVQFEQILASGYTAAPIITGKTANAITFSNTAFSGAGLIIAVSRPFSALE